MAPNLSTATQFLVGESLDFAVLDINLGADTTLNFAARVRDAGVPFIFASGYGQETSLDEPNQLSLIVSKPYDRETLRMAITKAQKEHERAY
jgi:two-component SAPR family response regulator